MIRFCSTFSTFKNIAPLQMTYAHLYILLTLILCEGQRWLENARLERVLDRNLNGVQREARIVGETANYGSRSSLVFKQRTLRANMDIRRHVERSKLAKLDLVWKAERISRVCSVGLRLTKCARKVLLSPFQRCHDILFALQYERYFT